MGWLLSSLGHVVATRVQASTGGQRRQLGRGPPPARSGPFTSDPSPSAAAAQPAPVSLPGQRRTAEPRLPPIPAALQGQLASSRKSWLRHCLESPLLDPVTNSRVHLLGASHFAPHGGGAGLSELQELVSALRPTVLAIEQPFDLAARAGLAYPEVIRRLEEEALACGDGGGGAAARAGLVLGLGAGVVASPLAGADPDGSSSHGTDGSVRERSREVGLAAAEAAAARLREALPGLAQRARVGRDLLDPFEILGLYSGCDYVTRPEQLAEALALFGFLPGLEYVALAQAAEQAGAQVYSVDAPLKLQEKWVEQLVADFKLRESDLSRRLQYDLARAQSLLPPDFHAWDAELAAAVQAREQLGLQHEGPGHRDQASGTGEGPPLSAVTAFKVSRALAAALVPFERSQDAFGLQASLQPLKYGLFARRARHLVLQVRDLCQRMSIRQVRVDAESVAHSTDTPSAQLSPSSQQQQPQAQQQQQRPQLVDVTGQPEQVVLAVVGRQYVHYIREMWANERSALWHGEVPRTFAPSSLER